ncbi:MAG: CapA family protein, partial [Lachnospiraceae bacterium]|nr:CapA family protein [Lachnospiraceae bacterium]
MKRAPLPLLIVLAALGGGLGILVRYFFFEKTPKNAGIITGSASAALWILIAAAVFLFSPPPSDPVYAAALPEAGTPAAEAAVLPDRNMLLPEEPVVEIMAPAEEAPELPVDPAVLKKQLLIAEHARTAAALKEESLADRPENYPEPVRITIAAIGDMLMHPGVSGNALMEDGTIDYSFIFEPIRSQIAAADIAVVNNEVPFGGNEHGLLNYPAFNVYSELGDAEAEAGFDVILNATNHVRDMGTEGILRTMEFWKKYPEIMSIGINESPEAQSTLHIIERKGVKIALFNYVYGINAGFPQDRP